MRGIAAGPTRAALALGFWPTGLSSRAARACSASSRRAGSAAPAGTWDLDRVLHRRERGRRVAVVPDWSFKSDVTPKTTAKSGCPGFRSIWRPSDRPYLAIASAWVAGVEATSPGRCCRTTVRRSPQQSSRTRSLSNLCNECQYAVALQCAGEAGRAAWNTSWYATGGAA